MDMYHCHSGCENGIKYLTLGRGEGEILQTLVSLRSIHSGNLFSIN